MPPHQQQLGFLKRTRSPTPEITAKSTQLALQVGAKIDIKGKRCGRAAPNGERWV
jgi:hypothetical protein